MERLVGLFVSGSCEEYRNQSADDCRASIEHEISRLKTCIPSRLALAGVMDQPCPSKTVFGSVPVEHRLSPGRLTKLSAARPEILRIGARRMRGVRKQPECEDAQSHTDEYEYPLHFLAQRQSAPIPDREASVDDRLKVVIIKSDLKHRAVRDWVARLVRLVS